MFEAEVEDLSRQTVAQRASVLVHPAEFYVALGALKERFFTAGGDLRASALAIEPSGAHRAGVTVKVELYSRKWIAAVEEHGDGGAHRSARLEDELVASVRGAHDGGRPRLRREGARGRLLRAPRLREGPARQRERASETFYGVEDTPRAAPRPGLVRRRHARREARAEQEDLRDRRDRARPRTQTPSTRPRRSSPWSATA